MRHCGQRQNHETWDVVRIFPQNHRVRNLLAIKKNSNKIKQINKINYLGINLTKEVKEIYDETYRTQKKLKKILEDGKISQVLGQEELILSKWPYYQKRYTYSMQFQLKSQ